MNGTIQYTIRPYDTIWMLAQVFNTTVDSIMDLNPGMNPRNLMVGQVIAIRPGYQSYPSYPSMPEGEIDQTVEGDMCGNIVDLMNYFRMLWEQHIEWTRMAVMAMIHNLPETDLIIQRLLRNPTDFANALAPFYGEEAAQEFARLFAEHNTIASELVRAAMSNDNNAVTDADRRWHENADQIAALLAGMNPYWNEDDWSAMLYEHLDMLSSNVEDMLSGNYEASISGYDEMEMQALEMADMMAEGISMQFPG